MKYSKHVCRRLQQHTASECVGIATHLSHRILVVDGQPFVVKVAEMNWQQKAECKGKTDLFFPDDEDPKKDAKIEKAKSICETCPFQAQCLEMGMKEKHGVWGMTTPQERIQIKRAERKQKKSSQ